MLTRAVAIFVITTVITVVSPVMRVSADQQIDSLVDPEAYSILSDLIRDVWASVSREELLLQGETTLDSMCEGNFQLMDAEWAMARDDFRTQNARPRLLQQSQFSMGVPFRLISRSEIEADDARLALKYPGLWQRRPESIEFVAVSAVGFNTARTKAIVYVRRRDRGAMNFLERQEGKWVRAFGGCGWIA